MCTRNVLHGVHESCLLHLTRPSTWPQGDRKVKSAAKKTAVPQVLRFNAPGPWLTRELRQCVQASDYDEMAKMLRLARDCIAWCRKHHPDPQSDSGIPVELLIDDVLAKAGAL
jgi:hypothetical protein